MKKWLSILVVIIALTLPSLCMAEPAVDAEFKVTLLGTGSPNPNIERFSSCTLVEAGNLNFVFDAGRGSAIRLWQAGVSLGRIDAVFLTHYHSDHTIGLPDLWLTGLINTPYGRRKKPLAVVGPHGVMALTKGLEAAYADDIKTRIADENLTPETTSLDAREFTGNGTVVFERNGVKVIAFEVDHGDKIKPSYGYRVDYKGHSVLISGDTRYSENLLKYAKGVDLLIHEVATVNVEALASNKGYKDIMAHHISPTEAGTLFTAAKPKLAVYTHLVFLSDSKFPKPTVEYLVNQTRKTYQGPLVIGQDLMSFTIGDEIKVGEGKK